MQKKENKNIFFNIFIIISLSFSTLFSASKCNVDYSIIYLIAMNERSLQRPIGYPYLISLNKKFPREYNKVKHQFNFINNRTIDCKSEKECISTMEKLLQLGIKNMDLGAFQINYLSFKFKDFSNYFNFKKSFARSCEIVYPFIRNKKNITFRDIARYHSSTPKYNKIYADNLEKNYKKLANSIKKRSR